MCMYVPILWGFIELNVAFAGRSWSWSRCSRVLKIRMYDWEYEGLKGISHIFQVIWKVGLFWVPEIAWKWLYDLLYILSSRFKERIIIDFNLRMAIHQLPFWPQDESLFSTREFEYVVAKTSQVRDLNISAATEERNWTTAWLEVCENLPRVFDKESGQVS